MLEDNRFIGVAYWDPEGKEEKDKLRRRQEDVRLEQRKEEWYLGGCLFLIIAMVVVPFIMHLVWSW